MQTKNHKNFWTRYFKVYDNLNLLIPYKELLKSVASELGIKDGDHILDAGCGTGNLTRIMEYEKVSIVGIDSNKEALDIFRSKNPEAEALICDITEELPFKDSSFDKIACSNVLYTLQKKQQESVIGEFYRTLKPGGVLVIVNPKREWKAHKIYSEGIKEGLSKNGIYQTIKIVFRLIIPTIKIFYYNYIIKKNSSYYFFTEEEQEELLKKCGFEIKNSFSVYANQSFLIASKK